MVILTRVSLNLILFFRRPPLDTLTFSNRRREEIQAPTTAIALDQHGGIGGVGVGKGQQALAKSKQRKKFDPSGVGEVAAEEWWDNHGNVLFSASRLLLNMSPY